MQRSSIVSRCRSWLVAFVLTGLGPLLHGSEPSPDDIKLLGLFTIGSVKYATLEVGGELTAAIWKTTGDTVGPYVVVEIRGDSVILGKKRHEADTAWIEVPLQQAVILPAGKGDAPNYTKEQIRWINSKQNPMVFDPAPVPYEAKRQWPELADEEVSAIQTWYLAHGWKLKALVLDEGFVEFSFENLFEDYRKRIVAQNHQRFQGSLSARQRALWDTIFGRASAPGETVKLDDLSESKQAEIRRNWAEFEASLTSEQQSMRRRLSDFTVDFPGATEPEQAKTAKPEGGVP